MSEKDKVRIMWVIIFVTIFATIGIGSSILLVYNKPEKEPEQFIEVIVDHEMDELGNEVIGTGDENYKSSTES